MKGYPRKTCKKAKAASLSLLCDGEEGLAALCEGVGGETCYPAVHKLRRAGRGFCGEPQVGDAREITIVSSSARRALQASLILGPRRSPPPGVFGKHSAHSAPACELNLLADSPSEGEPRAELDKKKAAAQPLQDDGDVLVEEGGERGLWTRIRERLQSGVCCADNRRPR